MRIVTNKEEYFYDFFQEIHPFLPDDEIYLAKSEDELDRFELVHYLEKENDMFANYVTICEFKIDEEKKTKKKISQSTFFRSDEIKNSEEKYIKRVAKLAIYSALSEYFNIHMPWGALTGVRPTKLALEYYHQNNDFDEVKNNLVKDYFLAPQKADLLVEILKNQVPIEINEKVVDFYVHIPFCTTRCSYCTFLSCEISKAQKFVEPYVDTLIEEITFTKQLLKQKKYKVGNVYIGGGTPTSLNSKQLDKILDALHFDDKHEFTVEAGRPDTITKEKLDVLSKHGVNRISINPQTFNEKALRAIGRAHTPQDIITAYELARKYPFIINMDLIAGLPYDDELFAVSLDKTLSLAPDNITIHTLSFKTKSPLTKESNLSTQTNSDITYKNVELAEQKLKNASYTPYYLYRQKNMIGNLENVGYGKNNTKCQFNINSMEDFSSVIACGANAISKRLFPSENRIERAGNVKDIITYLNRIDDMMQKKSELFS